MISRAHGLRQPLNRAWAGVLVAALALSITPVSSQVAAATTVLSDTPILDGNDDTEERERGKISHSSRTLTLGMAREPQTVGLRFTSVQVPAGSEIIAAWIQFTAADDTDGAASFDVAIEDTADAPALARGDFDLTARAVLTSTVPWTPGPWVAGRADADERTADLSALLAEIVSKPDWSAGNSIVTIITGTGSRLAHSANVSGDVAPRLYVQYETATSPNQPPIVDAGPDQTAQTGDTITLNGTATDDGLPNPPASLTTTWTLLTGPDTPTITNPNTPTTTATFHTPGTYTLQLTATDTELTTTATTTITITDPSTVTTISARVASGGADVEENVVTGSVSDTSTDLELVNNGDDQLVAMHFTDLAIPANSIILDAYIQFTTDETQSEPTDLLIRAVAEDDAAPFIDTQYGVSSRALTAASVAWSPPPWTTIGEAGVEQRTSSLTSVIQEIIERPGWADGNAIGLVITGSGHRTAEAWDGDPGAAPLLHIEFSDNPNDRPEVTISSPVPGESATEGVAFNFAATATDTEDGDVSSSLEWSSDRTGPIGSGSGFTASLPLGYHLITATATDSTGRQGSATVQISVTTTTPTLIGAGDIAKCGYLDDEATADILDAHAGATVFTAGDAAYDDGTTQEFAECYDPSWGRHREATRPSVGNHEYHVPGAADYFTYFGENAGTPGEGWYSYAMGSWQVIVLNSNCDLVECGPGSAQYEWLLDELAQHASGSCIAAYWHHPRFSSGTHGSSSAVDPFWQLLTSYGAELVVSGHDHNYERFMPMDATGAPNASGVRLFVVGTGGAPLRDFIGPALPTTDVRDATSHGVLKLALRESAYDWTFIPTAGDSFTDGGTAQCVEPVDGLPSATISAPLEGSVFDDADAVQFSASASDPEQGDLSSDIVWTSDRDGLLGSGASLTISSLSVGVHEISARVTDAPGRVGLARLTITIESASGNLPPEVSAGDDLTVAFGDPVSLSGSATDDGLPAPSSLTFAWELVSGEGTGTFDSPTSASTGVDFSMPGTYTIRLSVSDGELTSYDNVVIEVLDPTITQSVEVRIGRSAADAEESPSGKVDLSSSDLELAVEREDQVVGVVFEGVAVPAGAVITSAYIQFTTDEASSGNSDLLIRAFASDDAPTFQTVRFDISNRAVSDASQQWAPPRWNVVDEAGPDQRTPDLSSLVQEVVDRSGWAIGQSMGFVITGTGTRTAESYNGSTTEAPLLHIEFRLPPSGG